MLGTVQFNVAEVALTPGFGAHARSEKDITLSRLKSIHPHRNAEASTPAMVTGIEYVVPTSALLRSLKLVTPLPGWLGMVAPAFTAFPLAVPYSEVRLSAVTEEPSVRNPTTWLATGLS
ncbi:unannotated protein [freshwater metagenome]|uniref:Unannotated protein n=1 Tax=freshwater metagenome TaxID=449393 RepID=A0A6J6DB46_9ZZZZ